MICESFFVMTDISNFPAYVVSIPSARRRRRHISDHFGELGIKHQFADGRTDRGKIRGAAMGHAAAFDIAAEPPFLVFEDDVECIAGSTVLPEIPDGADAIYLGTSPHGCLPNTAPHVANFGHRSIPEFALASRFDEEWLRLHSMISAHAILFLTPSAVATYREQLRIAIQRKTPLDVRYAYLMRSLRVFTPNAPVFAEVAQLQPRTKQKPERLNLTRRALRPLVAGDIRSGIKRGKRLEAKVVEIESGKLDWEVTHVEDLETAEPITM